MRLVDSQAYLFFTELAARLEPSSACFFERDARDDEAATECYSLMNSSLTHLSLPGRVAWLQGPFTGVQKLIPKVASFVALRSFGTNKSHSDCRQCHQDAGRGSHRPLRD